VGFAADRNFAARPKSPLYGIWTVDESSTIQWAHRIIFDRPGQVTFQRTDNSLVSYIAAIDPERRTIVLSGVRTANFTYQRADGQLTLDGTMDDQPVHLALHDTTPTFPLINRGFHWIQDYPFNH